MTKTFAREVLDTIKQYDRIIIFRHFRPDGDAVGATKGLARILKLTYPDKEIYLQNADFSNYLAFLGGEDALLPDEQYVGALGIAMDTATGDRLSATAGFLVAVLLALWNRSLLTVAAAACATVLLTQLLQML